MVVPLAVALREAESPADPAAELQEAAKVVHNPAVVDPNHQLSLHHQYLAVAADPELDLAPDQMLLATAMPTTSAHQVQLDPRVLPVSLVTMVYQAWTVFLVGMPLLTLHHHRLQHHANNAHQACLAHQDHRVPLAHKV